MNREQTTTGPAAENRETLVATFALLSDAHQALRRLHDSGYSNTWLGVTSDAAADAETGPVSTDDTFGITNQDTRGTALTAPPTSEVNVDEPNVRGEGGNVFGAIGRLLGRKSGEPLHRELQKQGVSDFDTEWLETNVVVGDTLVTVRSANDPGKAVDILQACGGMVAGADNRAATERVTQDPIDALQGIEPPKRN